MKIGAIYLNELESAFRRRVKKLPAETARQLEPMLNVIHNAIGDYKITLRILPPGMLLQSDGKRQGCVLMHSSFYPFLQALHLCLLPSTQIEQQLDYCRTKFYGNYYVNERHSYLTLFDELVSLHVAALSDLSRPKTIAAIRSWRQKCSSVETPFAGANLGIDLDKEIEAKIITGLRKHVLPSDATYLKGFFRSSFDLPLRFLCDTNQISELIKRIYTECRTRTGATLKERCTWIRMKVVVKNSEGAWEPVNEETVMSVLKRRDREPKARILPDLFQKTKKTRRKRRPTVETKTPSPK
ncbi:MAG: hypothetical protein EOO69_12810 [Moraxellaceae bacterium]|nr:MAG: hypothetical protein EOO69_12810 [Moraxellaceae bacterium]